MNRRSFLVRLGQAAAAAALATTVDPEQLLWTPGKKTIIDLGATKQVLPATDHEVVITGGKMFVTAAHAGAEARALRAHEQQILRQAHWKDRDIRLDIGGTSFNYKGDKLVSLHSADELKKLDQTFATPHDVDYFRRRGGKA